MSTKPALMAFLFAIFALLCSLISGAILEKRPYLMLGNPDGISEPAFRGGGAPSGVPHETTLAAPATPATPAPAAIAATTAASALLTTPPTSATPPLITPVPTSGPVGPPGCVPFNPCNLFYQVGHLINPGMYVTKLTDVVRERVLLASRRSLSEQYRLSFSTCTSGSCPPSHTKHVGLHCFRAIRAIILTIP